MTDDERTHGAGEEQEGKLQPLPVEVLTSRHFLAWLDRQKISLALTTYQSARLMLIGLGDRGEMSGFERLFQRAMGLYAAPDRLYLSTRYQLWQLDNALAPGQFYNGYDKLYIPRIGYTTSDLDIHDVALDEGGRIIFVATRLNCLATISEVNSCQPLWKPPFISKVINEDRCHLNGMAMVDGKPGFVSACSRSDAIEGWRERRRDGGCIVSVANNEIVATGLSMPHSPRWYRDRLWVLNSGTGELGAIALDTGQFEPLAFCPGYLRGLAFCGDYAIVGLSKPRSEDRTFSGLELDEKLLAKDTDARCGAMVVNLHTGAIEHWLRLEGVVTELYDVQILPGVRRPMALGFQTKEIEQIITLDPMGEL